MAHKVNAWAWDRFNESLYAKRIKINDAFQSLYKITYKCFKNSNEMSKPIKAAEYIVAYDKEEAIKIWGKYKALIIKIEKIKS